MDLILLVIRIDGNRFYAQRTERSHLEHSVLHKYAIAIKRDGKYLLDKNIKN